MIRLLFLLTVSAAFVAHCEALRGNLYRGNLPGFEDSNGEPGSRSRMRQTFIISDPFSSVGSSFSSPFLSIVRKRPRFFFWATENFTPWTNWTACRKRSCRRFRYRQCRRGRKCPTDYLVEMTKCKEAPGCEDEKYNVTMEKNITSSCGIRPQLNLKILGGRSARPNSWPWQVSLFISNSKRGATLPSCGGTLIGTRWVVTAAHCLVVSYWPSHLPIGQPFHPSNNNLRVRVGDHDVRRVDSHEVSFNVREIIIHPGFKLRVGSCHNDIALLKLDRPVSLHRYVNVACLPSESMRLPPRTMCTALGWGVIKTNKRRSFFDWFRPSKPIRAAVLHEVEIPLVPYRECRREYPEFTLRSDSHLCAGKRNKDTCKGDSGGPLMCPVYVNGSRRWFVYGVTSFGSQSGCGQSYGVYSRVSHFSRWIKQMQIRLS